MSPSPKTPKIMDDQNVPHRSKTPSGVITKPNSEYIPLANRLNNLIKRFKKLRSPISEYEIGFFLLTAYLDIDTKALEQRLESAMEVFETLCDTHDTMTPEDKEKTDEVESEKDGKDMNARVKGVRDSYLKEMAG